MEYNCNTPYWQNSHPDWQGNITMVTDATGKVEQHTGYYPYGEPWSEPSGQPWLYGGKERMHDNGLNEYDFSARRLNSALCLWTTPDPLAPKFANTNPYVYCAANPIRFIDPTGKEIKVRGKEIDKFIHQLNSALNGIEVSLSNEEENNNEWKTLSFTLNGKKLKRNDKKIIEIMKNMKICVNINAENTMFLGKQIFCGGAFGGNIYEESYDNESATIKTHVEAYQIVNPVIFELIDKELKSSGAMVMHEITEAFEGAQKAIKDKRSSGMAGDPYTTYNYSHRAAFKQPITIIKEMFDKKGHITPDIQEANRIDYYIINKYKDNAKILIQQYLKP